MLIAECTQTGPTGWSCLVDMTLLTSPHADPPEDHSLPHFTKYKGRTSDHHFVWQSFSCLKLTCRLYVYAAKKSRHRKQRNDHSETTTAMAVDGNRRGGPRSVRYRTYDRWRRFHARASTRQSPEIDILYVLQTARPLCAPSGKKASSRVSGGKTPDKNGTGTTKS